MKLLLAMLLVGCGGNKNDPTGSGTTGDPGLSPRSPLCDQTASPVGDCASKTDCNNDGVCEADLTGPDGCGMCGVICDPGFECVDGHVCAPPAEQLGVDTYPRFTDLSHTDERIVGKAGSGVWLRGISDQFEAYGENIGLAKVSEGDFVLLADGTVGNGFHFDNFECDPTTYSLATTTTGDTLTDVAQFEGGPFSQLVGQSCARKTDGTVWCGPISFQQVPDLDDAVDIASGDIGCAVRSGGTIECWHGTVATENPGFGQPGAEGTTALPCVDDAVSIGAAGQGSFCAVRANGQVACFGEKWGVDGYSWYDAIPIDGLSDVVEVESRSAIALPFTNSCARTRNGDVYCFDRTTPPFLHPELSNAVDLEMGPMVEIVDPSGEQSAYVSVCVLHPDGARTCAPWDPSYAPGYAWTEDLVPDWCVDDPRACTAWVGMDTEASDKASCGWTEGGALLCWGSGSDARKGTGGAAVQNPIARDGLAVVDLPGAVIDAGIGTWHSCALQADGDVYCWGTADSTGVLGTGMSDGSEQGPELVISGADSLAVGPFTSCATKNQGEVWCWGANGDGQARGDALYGNGQGGHALVPALVGNLDAIDVAPGADQMCALISTGTVTCWGERPGEWYGVGPTDQGLSDIDQLVGREGVICAGDSAYEWSCWGDSWGGSMLGPISNHEQLADPVPMPHMSGARRVWPGTFATCMAMADETVVCRGTYGYELPCGLDCAQTGLEGAIFVASGSDPVVGFPDARGPGTFRPGFNVGTQAIQCEPFFEPFRYGKPLSR